MGLYLDQPDNCLLTSDQVQSYLNHISKSREDWQVKQAETSLRLYGYYLSSDASNTSGNLPPESAQDETLWASLEKKTRDAEKTRPF